MPIVRTKINSQEEVHTLWNDIVASYRAISDGSPEARHDIAWALVGKADCLVEIGTPVNLDMAISNYRESLYLCPENEVLRCCHKDQPTVIKTYARARLNMAIAYFKSRRFIEGQEEAETGLDLLRKIESVGYFEVSLLRERLFEVTLHLSLMAKQISTLPELVLEHLDPANPGAAPASRAMHRAALEHLRQGIAILLNTPQGSSYLPDYQHALDRLARIAGQYFAGTAAAAVLRAEDLERRGDFDAAREELENYIQARPGDSEGWRALGDFLVRRNETQASEAVYLEMARCLVFEAPEQTDVADRARRVAQVGEAILARRLAGLPAQQPHQLLAETDRLLLWLRLEFRDAVLRPRSGTSLEAAWVSQWQGVLNPHLEAVQPSITALRDRLLAAETIQQRQAAASAALDLAQGLLQQVTQGLTTPWRGYVEHITLAWREIAEERLPAWLAAEQEAERAGILEEAAQALVHAVEQATLQLADSELTGAEAALAESLGEALWRGVLAPAERKFLAAGQRCLGMAGMDRYAGLELGLALEASLRERLFSPLRDALLKIPQAELTEAPGLEAPLREFFTGQRGTLTFGPMVALYGALLNDWPQARTPLHAAMRDWLKTVLGTGAEALRGPGRTQWGQRLQALEAANRLRNQCAHTEALPAHGTVEGLWQTLVRDREVGFFHSLAAAGWQVAA